MKRLQNLINKRLNYSFNKHTIDRFKVVTDKE